MGAKMMICCAVTRDFLKKNNPTLVAFIGVNSAHGPSAQGTGTFYRRTYFRRTYFRRTHFRRTLFRPVYKEDIFSTRHFSTGHFFDSQVKSFLLVFLAWLDFFGLAWLFRIGLA